jgi:hypothetical protein
MPSNNSQFEKGRQAFNQEILTEGDGRVRLTSLCYLVYISFFLNRKHDLPVLP